MERWNGMEWNDHADMIVYLVERRLPRAQQKMKRRVALSPSKAANCTQVINSGPSEEEEAGNSAKV